MVDGKKPLIASSRVDHRQDVLKSSLASAVLPFRKGTNQVGMDNGHRAKFPHGLQGSLPVFLVIPLTHIARRAVAYEQTGQRAPTRKVRSAS